MQKTKLIAALVAACAVTGAWAAPTAEQIKQLGTTLTPWGAEIAGNKDGTIPAYTGGVTKAPAGYDDKVGRWVDLFPNEKPLYSINQSNVAQYASKLTDGTVEMIKRFPGFRVDVYPTHRTSVAMDKLHADAAIKNAKNPECKTVANGVGLRGCSLSTPFPIPSNGYEAMWNHLVKASPVALLNRAQNFVIDASGNVASPQTYEGNIINTYWKPGATLYEGEGVYNFRSMQLTTAPAREAGSRLMTWYSLKLDSDDQRAWSYTSGQRRVRLAPEFAYDTPVTTLGGALFYDEARLFAGRMDRFDFKLLGKQEMIVPYNTYKAVWTPAEKILSTKNFANPDYMRWELHRVWVVEATLKAGMRHAASKRRFYIDEDSWTAVVHDGYDQAGKVFRVILGHSYPNYTDSNEGGGLVDFYSSLQVYDLARGAWVYLGNHNAEKSFFRSADYDTIKPRFLPQAMAGSGVR